MRYTVYTIHMTLRTYCYKWCKRGLKCGVTVNHACVGPHLFPLTEVTHFVALCQKIQDVQALFKEISIGQSRKLQVCVSKIVKNSANVLPLDLGGVKFDYQSPGSKNTP